MAAKGRDLWLFAYGSLMWAHGLPVAHQIPARVRGWRRRFAQLSTGSWGTPERPGVCAVLCAGGSCGGLALRIAPGRELEARRIVERREANYQHVEVDIPVDGQVIRALTFAGDPFNRNFRPDLTLPDAACLIRTGAPGRRGTAREYLENTIRTLEKHGHNASPERDLLADVDGAHV